MEDLNGPFTHKDIRMTNKHMKRYSTSLVTMEMQIKPVMRCYYIVIRMAKITNIDPGATVFLHCC